MSDVLCNDGRCPITRRGEDRHTQHPINRRQIQNRNVLEGISILLLIVGITYGLLAFTIDGLNQMQFSFKCVYDAVYENASSTEYQDCVIQSTKSWFNAFYIHIFSTLSLAASAMIALLRRRT